MLDSDVIYFLLVAVATMMEGMNRALGVHRRRLHDGSMYAFVLLLFKAKVGPELTKANSLRRASTSQVQFKKKILTIATCFVC